MTQKTNCFWLAAFLWLVAPADIFSQSSVVQLPDANSAANSSKTRRMVSSQLPNNLPEALLQTERFLNRPMDSSWGSPMKFGRLMELMRRDGIRMRMDISADDNRLNNDSTAFMRLPGRSIAENFAFMLREYDCAYRITEEGTVEIHSNDSLLDNHDLFTYVVDSLAKDYSDSERLMDYIHETIDPDSWEPNGGNGRMEVMPTNRGYLLTVKQTYSNHVVVRKQLISMMRLGGGVASPEYIAGMGSRSVQLPNVDEDYSGSWTNGGSGGGGFGGGGLGGGVF